MGVDNAHASGIGDRELRECNSDSQAMLASIAIWTGIEKVDRELGLSREASMGENRRDCTKKLD